MRSKNNTRPSFLYEKSVEGEVLGIDEVGRGCVAGPVVAAGVILNNNINTCEINDSKKLSAVRREKVFTYLSSNCDYVVKLSSVEEIERINILEASLLAMRRVIKNVSNSKYNYIFVDGNISPEPTMSNIINIISGDKKSLSIAAASIIAKVTRDSIMDRLDKKYPKYLWKKNKGYCTRYHIDAIRQYGITPYHRKSFLRKVFSSTL